MVFIDENEVDSRLENEGCLFDWEEHDKQIRAAAIDECIKLFKEMQPKLATNVIEFGDMLEQLKEKSNE
jgi:hypothetical protein